MDVRSTKSMAQLERYTGVERYTGDWRVASSRLTAVRARHFNPGRHEVVPTWLKNCWLGYKASKTNQVFIYLLFKLKAKKINIKPLFWKTNEAGRFLFFYYPKNRWGHFFFYFIENYCGTLLFILSTKMLIFLFWHMNEINEATFFLFKSEKKWQMMGIWNRWGRAWETFFFYWPNNLKLSSATNSRCHFMGYWNKLCIFSRNDSLWHMPFTVKSNASCYGLLPTILSFYYVL